MRPSAQRCFPCPGNTLPGPSRISRRQRCSTFGFTSSARATSPIVLPRSSRCTAASLNSFVNILLDNPMTQFSFGWILSLNRLCQKWGQVHSGVTACYYRTHRTEEVLETSLDCFPFWLIYGIVFTIVANDVEVCSLTYVLNVFLGGKYHVRRDLFCYGYRCSGGW